MGKERKRNYYYEVVKELKLSCDGEVCKIGKNTQDIFNKYNHELNHYFRHIFSIIKYVNESKILNDSVYKALMEQVFKTEKENRQEDSIQYLCKAIKTEN